MPSRDGPVIIVSHPEKSVANMISLTLRGSGFEAIAVEPQDGQGLVELVLTTGQQIQQRGGGFGYIFIIGFCAFI